MRWKWTSGICVILIIALMAAVYVLLATYDYNKLKPHIARMVKDATGRELNLGGKINLAIGFSPALAVTDIAFANASWGSQPEMITVQKLQAQVRLLPLLRRNVEVNNISFAGVEVLLETDPKGKGNWDFIVENRKGKSAGAFTSTEIDIDDIHIENLRFIFLKGETGSTRQYTLTSLDVARGESEDELTLGLKADYNSQPIELSGKIGQIHNLFRHQRFPLNLSGAFSNATVKVVGAVENLSNLTGIDLKLDASGLDLSEIGSIIGQALPITDHFALKGRLTGSAKSLSLKEAQGNVIRGSLRFTANGAVKDFFTLKGFDLQSELTGKDLAEFGVVIGEKLPATDQFEIKGRLIGSSDALTLREAQASARRGSLRFTVNGVVKDLLNLSGMDLNSTFKGKNLEEFGEIIGEKLPASDQFEIQGRLIGSTDLLALQAAQGSAGRDSMRLNLTGAVKDLITLSGMDLQSKLNGNELAEMGPMFGSDLPDLGPFEVGAKLSGSSKAIALDDFSAMVDKSDFKGRAKIELLKRPKITAHLDSSVIDFTALMKSFEKNQQKPADKAKQKRSLFSDAPLPLDLLKKMDADFVLKARNIHSKDARLEFGHMTLKLQDHDFSIDTLEATYKETKISGNLQIMAGTPSQLSTHFLVQNFNLGDFLKETGRSDQVRAIVDIAAHGKSKGDSVHSLMANLNGSIGAVMGEGYLTKYLDLLSIGLSQKVFHFWKAPKAVDQIKCAVIQFDIKEGVAVSQAFVFDTQAGVLAGEGKINLGTEKINFLLVPKPAHPELSILSNLRVSGSVMEPHVGADKASVLTQSAKALSFLAVGPLGLLAPFVHLGANKSHPCDVPSIGQLVLNTPAKK